MLRNPFHVLNTNPLKGFRMQSRKNKKKWDLFLFFCFNLKNNWPGNCNGFSSPRIGEKAPANIVSQSYTASHEGSCDCTSQGTEKQEMGSGEWMIAQYLLHLISCICRTSISCPGVFTDSKRLVAVTGTTLLFQAQIGGHGMELHPLGCCES